VNTVNNLSSNSFVDDFLVFLVLFLDPTVILGEVIIHGGCKAYNAVFLLTHSSMVDIHSHQHHVLLQVKRPFHFPESAIQLGINLQQQVRTYTFGVLL